MPPCSPDLTPVRAAICATLVHATTHRLDPSKDYKLSEGLPGGVVLTERGMSLEEAKVCVVARILRSPKSRLHGVTMHTGVPPQVSRGLYNLAEA